MRFKELKSLIKNRGYRVTELICSSGLFIEKSENANLDISDEDKIFDDYSVKYIEGGIDKDNGDDGIVKVYVDEESIGQYTGYKDKNGKKIFEGDVINWHVDYYGYKEHWEDGFRIFPETLDMTDYKLKDISPICEVVNNKYEDTRYVKE